MSNPSPRASLEAQPALRRSSKIGRRPFFVTVVLLCICPAPVHAARLLTVSIERNGTVLQKLYFQDDGLADRAELCRMLGQPPLGFKDEPVANPPGNNPLELRLDGPITVRIRHVDGDLLVAKLDNLLMVRPDANSNRWHLPPDELARLAQTAGIDLNPASGQSWIGLSVFLVVAVVLGVVLSRVMKPVASD